MTSTCDHYWTKIIQNWSEILLFQIYKVVDFFFNLLPSQNILTLNPFFSNNNRWGCHLIHSTCTIPPVDPVIALFTPSRTPRIFDNPKWHIFSEHWVMVNSKTNNQNSMIKTCRRAEKFPGMRHPTHVKLHGIGIDTNSSMTQLLTHSVAHSTKPSSRPKTNNQPLKKFLSVVFSWVKVVKNWTSF